MDLVVWAETLQYLEGGAMSGMRLSTSSDGSRRQSGAEGKQVGLGQVEERGEICRIREV